MGISSAEGALYPPLSPSGEAPATNIGDFARTCAALFSKALMAKKATLGMPVLTQVPGWGRVFRADFELGTEPTPGFVNRFICWETASGKLESLFAIGQQVPPLNVEK